MTATELEAVIGRWEQRNAWTLQLADEVKGLLAQAGLPVEIFSRAKADESILEKMSRFSESVGEIHDLYGFRVVTEDFDGVERVADLIVASFGETPTEKDMTIRSGTLVFQSFRNYRKRDWVGVSPATSGGYNEAIHLNRKVDGRMVEFQIITRTLYVKYCQEDADEGHAAFKHRQSALHHRSGT